MACSNPWNSVFQVGSHHIAHQFMEMGYEVAFISDPISPLHIIRGSDVKKRLQLYRTGGEKKENLWAYVPGALLTPHNFPLLRLKWLHQYWHNLTIPNLLKKVKKNGFDQVDILYFDTAVQAFWLDHIKARKTVFRIADQSSGFRKTTQPLLEQERRLIKDVDLVICTAKTLTDQIPGSIHFPNGVSIEHFSKQSEVPKELKKVPRPIAIYVGAIDYWFDFSLLKKVALDLPHISFVLIGPMKENPFKDISNIFCLGPKEYDQIPSYIKQSQVGLIPFDVQNYPELIHRVNPLKLYEYMACSLPVVATKWEELEKLNSPAFLSNSIGEFKSCIEKALNSPSKKYREYAEKQDWSYKGKKLLELLS